MKRLIFILAGPTGSGKTSLSLSLARKFPIEIVNADSLQMFREMNIGTAKPSNDILSRVTHHMIDVLDPDQDISAAWYAKEASKAIEAVFTRAKIPLLVGGAGFYLRALLRPPMAPPSKPSTDSLLGQPAGQGKKSSPITPEEMLREIEKKDPQLALQLHPKDEYRIARAFFLLNSGEIPSLKWAFAAHQEPKFESLWFGIDPGNRQDLYQRINQRVIDMFEEGLVEETKKVLELFPSAAARLGRTIGYKESLDFLHHDISLREAKEKTMIASRQYAKRQLTWFRNQEKVTWIGQNRIEREMSRIMEAILS